MALRVTSVAGPVVALLLLAVAANAAMAPAAAPGSSHGMDVKSLAAAGLKTNLLLPKDDGDLGNFLLALMQSQHQVVMNEHGADSPQAFLSLQAMNAQNILSQWYLQFQNNPPGVYWPLYYAVTNFSALANSTLYAISPRLAANVAFTRPFWFRNQPKVATVAKTGINVGPTLIGAAPCLINVGPTGIGINPTLINISPKFIQVDPIGINVEPKSINIGPTFINVQPSATNAGLTRIKVAPTFIEASPNVAIQPNSGKVPVFSENTVIKPIPDPPSYTNEVGKSKSLPIPGGIPGPVDGYWGLPKEGK